MAPWHCGLYPSVGWTPMPQGYELVFVGSGERWKGGAANIRQKQDSDVWGVVWRLEEQDLPSLQLQEHGYTQMEVEVKAGDDGRIYPCHTFQLRLPGHWTEEAPPSPHYKDVIVRGARQNHLPCHYLQRLQAVQDNGYEGKVEVYDAVIALLNDTTGVKRE
ncbi:hypothetical protein ACOMHN_018392 [Nucella lapillus]